MLKNCRSDKHEEAVFTIGHKMSFLPAIEKYLDEAWSKVNERVIVLRDVLVLGRRGLNGLGR